MGRCLNSWGVGARPADGTAVTSIWTLPLCKSSVWNLMGCLGAIWSWSSVVVVETDSLSSSLTIPIIRPWSSMLTVPTPGTSPRSCLPSRYSSLKSKLHDQKTKLHVLMLSYVSYLQQLSCLYVQLFTTVCATVFKEVLEKLKVLKRHQPSQEYHLA